MSGTLLRAFLSWMPMVAIAVANGIFREAWLLPRLGEHHARQASTLLLLLLFAVYIGVVTREWPARTAAEAVLTGAVWLVLTLGFEFALGHFVSRLSWPQMLAEYNVAAGRLWILVPAWVATAPYAFHRLRA